MYTVVTKHVGEYLIMNERNVLSKTRSILNIYEVSSKSVKLDFSLNRLNAEIVFTEIVFLIVLSVFLRY